MTEPFAFAAVVVLERLPEFTLDEFDVAARLRPYEELCLRTPIARHRQALIEAGAPIAEVSYGQHTPRRGVMKID